VVATAFPANLTFLGMAKEAVSGTPETAPTIWVPLESPSWKPDQKQLVDEGLRGNMAKTQGVVAGVRSDTISYSTGLFMDSLFPHMLAILGTADAVSGTTAPYTHTTSLKNTTTAQPPSYTLWLFNGAEAWQMAGSHPSKVEVDIKAEELGKLAAEWMGLPATQVATPTNTPSTNAPWPGWNSTLTVAGVQATTYSDMKLAYVRECKAVQTADGTQSPLFIFVGPLDVDIDVNGVYQGVAGAPTDLAYLIANTQVAVTAQVNPVGDATHYGKWTHTVCASMTSEVKDSAGTYVEIASKLKAVSNSTDATGGGTSPVKFQLVNTAVTAF
jgi:hypothetical protein